MAVWVGYDNADGKRRTLGGGATGGGVAVPIFEPIIQAVWAHAAPKTALAPPPFAGGRDPFFCGWGQGGGEGRKTHPMPSGRGGGGGFAVTPCPARGGAPTRRVKSGK